MSRGHRLKESWQNRMAGQADRSIAQDKKRAADGKKTETSAQRFQREFEEALRPKSFKELWPSVGGWEIAVGDELKVRQISYSNINEAKGWTGLQAKEWVRSLYEAEKTPREAAREIRTVLAL